MRALVCVLVCLYLVFIFRNTSYFSSSQGSLHPLRLRLHPRRDEPGAGDGDRPPDYHSRHIITTPLPIGDGFPLLFSIVHNCPVFSRPRTNVTSHRVMSKCALASVTWRRWRLRWRASSRRAWGGRRSTTSARATMGWGCGQAKLQFNTHPYQYIYKINCDFCGTKQQPQRGRP